MLKHLVKEIVRQLLRSVNPERAPASDDEKLFEQAKGCIEAGKTAEAREILHRVIELNPNHADSLYELGRIAMREGEIDAAIAWLAKATSVNSRAAHFYNTYGNLRQARGELEEAARLYREAISVNPDFAEAYANIGMVLCKKGETEAGLPFLRKAIEIGPRLYEAHNALGFVSLSQGNPDNAVASLNQAIALKPDFAEGHNNLGLALQQIGRFDDAMASYRRALELKPDFTEAHSNLIHALGFVPHADLAEQLAERRRWQDRHVRSRRLNIDRQAIAADPHRKLRIGYVSADFRRHSAASGFGPVLLYYDRTQFEVICYSNSFHEDDITARFRKSVTLWRNICEMPDDKVVRMIGEDGIDILVDLSGHSAGNRLLVFARKPAPLQVTAWGHATGTGLDTMDYLFSDEVTIPSEKRHYYSEEIIYLPCVMGYMPQAESPPLKILPALQNGYITFGFFNNYAKLADDALNLWARLLAEAPNSKILFKARELGSPGRQRERVSGRFIEAGVEVGRIRFLGATS